VRPVTPDCRRLETECLGPGLQAFQRGAANHAARSPLGRCGRESALKPEQRRMPKQPRQRERTAACGFPRNVPYHTLFVNDKNLIAQKFRFFRADLNDGPGGEYGPAPRKGLSKTS